jgi:glycosyltransferase involved in cell wall biosynthesis
VTERHACFSMPKAPQDWGGAAALWVTVAGWAQAAEANGYRPAITTPRGELTIGECLEATGRPSASATGGAKRGAAMRLLVRDAQRTAKALRYRRRLRAWGPGQAADFTWTHHDLFHDFGHRSGEYGRPRIDFVHAPIVWEAHQWGVNRPGWGGLLERLGERPQLMNSDLIACVSDEVAEQVQRLGADPSKVMVTPMGVDPDRFSPAVPFWPQHERLRSGADFVIGWVGSVRRFHAIDLALEAVRDLRRDGLNIKLVIAGDGQDRQRLLGLADELAIKDSVEFVGQVPNTDVPAVLRCFDAAVITAAAGQQFHYSPLKLREYLSMALPVVAPATGEIRRLIEPDFTGLLYEPGDVAGLAAGIARLYDDRSLRDTLATNARGFALRTSTWSAIAGSAYARLGLV